ncbi:hypothetical protein NLJ89_g10265 [Agrocybe chaxingu]|uniref:F-box domain-containing protein n=1 Tax=Agrocybe chaxingu TaxID=84603 RepID=A0A9W8JRL7_9AGAR|nr:hypothetical protein NLJ89_g10265 [Agrocybe chaxingu]
MKTLQQALKGKQERTWTDNDAKGRLPKELLKEIFQLFVALHPWPFHKGDANSPPTNPPAILAQVCGCWQDIVQDMPDLWTRLPPLDITTRGNSKKRHERFTRFVDRSRGSRLSVHITRTGQELDLKLLKALFDNISPRIESLCFDATASDIREAPRFFVQRSISYPLKQDPLDTLTACNLFPNFWPRVFDQICPSTLSSTLSFVELDIVLPTLGFMPNANLDFASLKVLKVRMNGHPWNTSWNLRAPSLEELSLTNYIKKDSIGIVDTESGIWEIILVTLGDTFYRMQGSKIRKLRLTTNLDSLEDLRRILVLTCRLEDLEIDLPPYTMLAELAIMDTPGAPFAPNLTYLKESHVAVNGLSKVMQA